MKRLLPMLPLGALLLTTMAVGPCDSKPLGSLKACTYQGAQHPLGASWPSMGGTCNDCTCTDSGAVCAKTACSDAGGDAAATCFDSQGKVIPCADGGSKDAAGPDGSSTCTDPNGTLIPCSNDGGTIACMYLGMPYAVGATFPSADGCNSCTCESSGMVACTTKACDDGGADAQMACSYGGKTYPIGSTFPAGDGCNSCTCYSAGYAPCTMKACDTDAGTGADGSAMPSCAFDATYSYGYIGGLTAFADVMTLSPPSSFQIVRTTTPNGGTVNQDGMCAPPLPACGSGDGKSIDVSIVMNDIADATVQLLLSLTATKTITLGQDPRPMDGSIFSFRKDDGAGFLVGGSCMGSTTDCTEPPPAVLKLKNDLAALDQQERQDMACAGALSMGQ